MPTLEANREAEQKPKSAEKQSPKTQQKAPPQEKRSSPSPAGFYAIAVIGGKQYRVSRDCQIQVDPVKGQLTFEPGSTVRLDKLLMVVDGDRVTVGSPYVLDYYVVAEVTRNILGPKIQGFNYKPKKNERKRWGHRQPYVVLTILGFGHGKLSEKEKQPEGTPRTRPIRSLPDQKPRTKAKKHRGGNGSLLKTQPDSVPSTDWKDALILHELDSLLESPAPTHGGGLSSEFLPLTKTGDYVETLLELHGDDVENIEVEKKSEAFDTVDPYLLTRGPIPFSRIFPMMNWKDAPDWMDVRAVDASSFTVALDKATLAKREDLPVEGPLLLSISIPGYDLVESSKPDELGSTTYSCTFEPHRGFEDLQPPRRIYVDFLNPENLRVMKEEEWAVTEATS